VKKQKKVSVVAWPWPEPGTREGLEDQVARIFADGIMRRQIQRKLEDRRHEGAFVGLVGRPGRNQ
jgi:hypothetical protein